MSDNEDEAVVEKPFAVDRAKTGRAGCKKCKQKIEKGEIRFGKLGHNPFGSGTMTIWHHVPCMFEVFKRQRATTRKIESPDDIAGWNDITEDDRTEIMKHFPPHLVEIFQEAGSPRKLPDKKNDKKTDTSAVDTPTENKDNSFRAFRKICVNVANESSYTGKTSIMEEFFTKGSDGIAFKGDLELWCRSLLPGVVKVVYNLQSKQLVKIFSRIFKMDQDEMLEDLEKGDVAETIGTFFEKSSAHKPSTKALLTLPEVDNFLKHLAKLTKEDDQQEHFTKILKRCTSNDLRMILRLIKHDLRINAGAKPVLSAIHPDAYEAFQTSRDIKVVVANALKANKVDPINNKDNSPKKKGIAIKLSIMTPVLPMLAQACKSVAMAFKKCPNGMFSEIKYDGERVQVHKQGNDFKYYSRSLKPVLPHKVNHFKDYLPLAFPHGKDLILDAEVLLVDTNTGKPLPFGTLGKHKKNEFQDASVCLFVFDCIFYNGESLLNKPLDERKGILDKNMVEIKNHVMVSEMEEVHKTKDLEAMITKVFKLGLEGLVLKDLKSTYEPGKRHWLKVKKDYLFDGAMADSADLVVLGAWFGTGNKGGIMSSFLMGCYNPGSKKWVTVTKVHGGHDDETLDKIQKELEVVKISKDVSKVPSWLKCTKTMVPDFVAKDPENMPVWEITGAEFTCNQVHTADGISVRFPRVTKIRHDKDWKTATNFKELKKLYEKSKDTSDFSLDIHKTGKDSDEESAPGPSGVKRKGDKNSEKKEVKKLRKSGSDEETAPGPSGVKPTAETKSESDSDTETETEDEPAGVDDENCKTHFHDIFTDSIIEMPKKYKDSKFLRRYIIAYGGVLYDLHKNTAVENSKGKVTHVVYDKPDSTIESESYWAKDVLHVQINWVWDSIKLLKRQKEKNYLVPKP